MSEPDSQHQHQHQQPRQFTRRARPDAPTKRDNLIEVLAKRFYMDEQGTLISNGLSTELICFPSDVRMHHRYLNEKIYNALSYATGYTDDEVMNALRYLSNIKPDYKRYNQYMAMGLYLYYADEFSRLRQDTTFLSAMRDGGVGVKIGTKYSYVDLASKVQNALGLEDSHVKLLWEWVVNGNYTIQGKCNAADQNGKNLQGNYALLAEAVLWSKNSAYFGLNYAISFALANKKHVEGLSAEGALKRVQDLLANPKEIEALVDEGFKMREERIRKNIFDKLGSPGPVEPADKIHDENTVRQAKSILLLLPDPALEILFREGYMLAYANHGSVRKCYPKEDLPGVSEDQNKKSRHGKAGRQGRYRMIFLSNGLRENPDDLKDDNLRAMIAAQSTLHEVMHIAIRSYLTDDEKQALQKSIESISPYLQQHPETMLARKLRTIDTNTFSEVADFTSRRYPNYGENKDEDRPDTRWEEVACELYGLLHTEYHPFKGGARPSPFQEIEPLRDLAAQLDSVVEHGCTRCCAQYEHVKLERKEKAARSNGFN